MPHTSPAAIFDNAVLPRLRAEANGCVVWTGAKNDMGYGQIRRNGTALYTHRLSYQRHFNIVLTGRQHVLHKCDNPPCCNPQHLFLGSPTTNMADAKAKGRMAIGNRLPQSILTESEVRHIRLLRAQGLLWKDIAASVGHKFQTVYEAGTGRKWKHVTGAA